MKKKILASLFSAATILLCIALPVSAKNEVSIAESEVSILETSGTCGDNLTWTLNDGTLTISGTGAIENMAFYNNESIINVIIEEGVTGIGGGAFDSCRNLTHITIPDSVTRIGYMVFYETKLYNNTENWVDDVLYIGNHLISAKTEISGDYVIKDGTKTMADNIFFGCGNLTSVTIPDSVKTISINAFWYCDELTSVTFGDGVTSIGDYAFSCCSSLSSITIPDTITSIGEHAFEMCSNLTHITIPDSVTSIGNGMFWGCTNLESITIHNGVTSIGKQAFYDCSNLKDVYYTGTESEWNEIEIGTENNEYLLNATIHYNYEPYTFTWISGTNTAKVATDIAGTYDVIFINTAGDISSVEVTFDKAGEKEVAMPNGMATTGLKIFLWDSLERMKPLADAITVN